MPGFHRSARPSPRPSLLSKSRGVLTFDTLPSRGSLLRLKRFVTLAHQPSINQAARAVGCSGPNLRSQLAILEYLSGGRLVQRNGTRPGGPVTPLGQDLCRQAQEHLGIAPIRPTT
jgi:hypothetical protein